MKFLHISTGDSRGAASGAYRLHSYLRANGHQSKMVVMHKFTNDEDVVSPNRLMQIINKVMVKLTNQFVKISFGWSVYKRHSFKIDLPFSRLNFFKSVINFFEPDLVVVYYTADFISNGQLSKILKSVNAPVALYLMDMGPLTGSCHYAWTCKGYSEGCYPCPVANNVVMKKLIAKSWRNKDELYSQVKPTVVVGSDLLFKQSTISSLTKNLNKELILMGVDSDIFCPGSKVVSRNSLGIPYDGLLILFGAQNINDPRKGFDHLLKACAIVHGELSDFELSNIALLTVGRDRTAGTLDKFKRFHIDYIDNAEIFSCVYKSSDLFVCPSVEDSGPMMINEAVISGLPVISFDMGVAPNLIENDINGYIVPCGDYVKLADAILKFIRFDSKKREEMEIKSRAIGLARTSIESQVKAFEQLAVSSNSAPQNAVSE